LFGPERLVPEIVVVSVSIRLALIESAVSHADRILRRFAVRVDAP
jgi:hypothetical protein